MSCHSEAARAADLPELHLGSHCSILPGVPRSSKVRWQIRKFRISAPREKDSFGEEDEGFCGWFLEFSGILEFVEMLMCPVFEGGFYRAYFNMKSLTAHMFLYFGSFPMFFLLFCRFFYFFLASSVHVR